MKWYNKTLRGFRAILIIYASLVIIDMFILKAKIKNMIVALGNTSSVNPMGTDGMVNYLVILFCVALALWIIPKYFGHKEDKEGK